ncbi:radical SAM family heme chaperone HemW [bacterium]|nr:radical SAM family heme chaperone HemW [bacterium]
MKKSKEENCINSAYIHVPFCLKKCAYCSFLSFEKKMVPKKYLYVLNMEINKKYNGEKLKTLYFGGGTPSILSISQVATILKNFNFEKDAEITFEVNPKTVDLAYLTELRMLGVNRLSIGVQSFNDEILSKIKRMHNSACALDTIKMAHKAGFDNISIDLMYGLPAQTMKIWAETLNVANNLPVQHISLYGLKIDSGSKFYNNMPKNLPTLDEQADMYELAIEKLTKFKQYEISNFAISEDFQGKHNLNYWNLGKYYAFGLGASGFSELGRYQNQQSLDVYCKLDFESEYEEFESPEEEKEVRLNEAVMLAFRLVSGVDKALINAKFNIDFDRKYAKPLKKYLETGHIKETKKGYAFTTKGFLLSNNILSEFI